MVFGPLPVSFTMLTLTEFVHVILFTIRGIVAAATYCLTSELGQLQLDYDYIEYYTNAPVLAATCGWSSQSWNSIIDSF